MDSLHFFYLVYIMGLKIFIGGYMRKILFLLFAFVSFVACSHATTVRDIDTQAWLEHLSHISLIRQKIYNLISKEERTVHDLRLIENLNNAFEVEKELWNNYLVRLASGEDATPPSQLRKDYPNRFTHPTPDSEKFSHRKNRGDYRYRQYQRYRRCKHQGHCCSHAEHEHEHEHECKHKHDSSCDETAQRKRVHKHYERSKDEFKNIRLLRKKQKAERAVTLDLQ